MTRTRAKRRIFTLTTASLLILVFAAFMTRVMPLSISQYPFNNDSISESLLATQILDTGSLVSLHHPPWQGTHTALMPVLNILLAFLAGLLGTTTSGCAQVFGAVVAVATIGGMFLLGRLVSGSVRGATTAAFAAVMFGTFVFTTGSIWKEMLGLCLLVFVLLAYMRRGSLEFRILAFIILMIIPLVHHLVAAVTFLVFILLLVWSFYYAISRGVMRRTNLYDLATVAIPGAFAVSYYSAVGFGSVVQISSAMNILLVIGGFIVISIISVLILSLRRHAKRSFAPFVGIVLAVLILLDYSGYVFPYSPSASSAYALLALGSAFLASLAWFGSEVILETRPRYRAVQLSLLLSPLTILGFGIVQGITVAGQKVLYRSFDFLDLFIFLGLAVAVVEIHSRRRRLYPIVGAFVIVSLAVSFPFAYATQPLLGVRHDTQGYELDALMWMGTQRQASSIVSDERLAYLAHSVLDVAKDSSLPQYIATRTPFPSYMWFYIIEDSWTTIGVNYYPNGELVVNSSYYEKILGAADIYYIGGPANDNIVIFLASPIGSNTVYGHSG